MGGHLIVELDKSWSLTDQRLLILLGQCALLTKFQGVPCQEVGGRGYKQCIFDCTTCRYRVQQRSVLEKHMRSEH